MLSIWSIQNSFWAFRKKYQSSLFSIMSFWILYLPVCSCHKLSKNRFFAVRLYNFCHTGQDFWCWRSVESNFKCMNRWNWYSILEINLKPMYISKMFPVVGPDGARWKNCVEKNAFSDRGRTFWPTGSFPGISWQQSSFRIYFRIWSGNGSTLSGDWEKLFRLLSL